MITCSLYAFGGIVLAIAFYGYLRFSMWYGTRTCVSEVASAIRFILERGFDGSKMWLKDARSRLRIEFQKTISQPGRARFFMIVDSRYCSSVQFRAAQEALAQQGIEFTVARDNLRGTGSGDRISVDCGPDEMKATRAAKAVLMMAFGLSENSPLRASHWGGFEYRQMSKQVFVGWDREGGGDRNRKQK